MNALGTGKARIYCLLDNGEPLEDNLDLKCFPLKAELSLHYFFRSSDNKVFPILPFIFRKLVRILHKFVNHFENHPPLPHLSEMVQLFQKIVRRQSDTHRMPTVWNRPSFLQARK